METKAVSMGSSSHILSSSSSSSFCVLVWRRNSGLANGRKHLIYGPRSITLARHKLNFSRASLDYSSFDYNNVAAAISAISICLLPVVWLNARKRIILAKKKLYSTSEWRNERDNSPEEEKGQSKDNTSAYEELSHEFPHIKESLRRSYLDIEMEQQIHLANEEHLSSLKNSVGHKNSTCPENKVQDRDGLKDIAGEIQGAGNGISRKRRYLVEEIQEIGTGKPFDTNNRVQESGSKGLMVNEMRSHAGDHDAERNLQMVTNEVQKSSTAGSSINLVTEDPHLLEKLSLTREGQQTENNFGVDIKEPFGSDVCENGHNNLNVSEHLEALFISHEKSNMPEKESSDVVSAEDQKSEKMEIDCQRSLHLANHEDIDKKSGATHSREEETILLFAKNETWNPSNLENCIAISGAALGVSATKKRIWDKSHGCSVAFDLQLKDLLPVNSTKGPFEYMKYYDRWLRAGRLKDCLELLESMDKVGALDMNKVYHAKFFEICREKRAVQEAFRFVNLVEKPKLSTFSMLLAVCASAEDVEAAFQVLPLVKTMGLKADCKLYTALISCCAKGGKVDIMFKVFHEMTNTGIEPSIYTYGALIDGCARAGQVAKAFGVYGIMRSKNMKPDRVIFNALIMACGRAGAVDRAFDILSEMRAEPHPLDPDHVTVGSLINACSKSRQVNRALEVYKMVKEYGIKGTADVYTMAVNACSHNGDLDFALSVYDDMRKNEVQPDEVFFSALIDAAGHAGKIDYAFKILADTKNQGLTPGSVMYSSLMGACSNARSWEKALEVYEEIKGERFIPTVSTFNALITSLCDAGKLHKSIEILEEMKQACVPPNSITYKILLIACQKEDEPELAFNLFSRTKMDGVIPNLTICDCVISLFLQRFQKASVEGQSLVCYDSGGAQIHNQWTSRALQVYRQTISAGVTPTMEALSRVLGCLRIPYSAEGKFSINEAHGLNTGSTKRSNLYSFTDGFGIYDPRAFSLYQEAASHGVVPSFPYKDNPVSVDVRDMHVYTAEVYLLTILKGLKHRFAAGAQLPNITVQLPVEKVPLDLKTDQKLVNVSGRSGQAVASLLRRLNLSYQGNESYGKIRIAGKAIKHWLSPKGRMLEPCFSDAHLGKVIGDQQRTIRTKDYSVDGIIGSLISQNSGEKLQRPWRGNRNHKF